LDYRHSSSLFFKPISGGGIKTVMNTWIEKMFVR
jgi:hypothetical protein